MDYDAAIGPCRTILRFLGAWPDPTIPDNVLSYCHFIIVALTMFTFAIVAQTTMLLKVWGDLNDVIDILTMADIPIFNALIKYLVTWYNKEDLKKLVVLMIEDWNRPQSERDLQVMSSNAKFGRELSIMCISFSQGTITAQLIMILIFKANRKVDGERALYMISHFPYDALSSPKYELTWLGQCFANIFAASAFCAVDGFFAILVLHLCSQFKILRKNIKEVTIESKGIRKDKEFGRNVARIVERHEQLNKFGRIIEDSFNLMLLVQMLASSLILYLQGSQLILIINGSENGFQFLEVIHMVYFTGCFLCSLFVYCYLSEKLRSESTDIDYAVFGSNWYNLPPRDTKLLIFLMHRARKPLEITAGKFCALSLQLYCSILKTTGGYLSILLAVRDRLVMETME